MKKHFCCLLLLFGVLFLNAQKPGITEYNRAAALHIRNLVNKRVFNPHITVTWFPDSTGFSFTTQDKNGKQFNQYLYSSGKTGSLFNHERFADSLSRKLNKPVKSTDLPLSDVRYTSPVRITFTAEGQAYELNIPDYKISRTRASQPNRMEQASPDGKWIAYTENHNLFVRSGVTGEKKQLSTAGKKDYEYASFYGWGEIIEGENGERPPHFRVQWSPDSKWIHTFICDLSKGQKMYLLDWSIDTLYRPKLLSYYRGSPGDTDMVYMVPVIFNVETGEEVLLTEFRNVNAASFEWSEKPSVIYAENQVRGYQQTDLYQYDMSAKTKELLYSEKSKTNTDGYNSWMLETLNKAIIASENDGWRQLYILDLKNKNVTPLTKGEYYINDIAFIDKPAKSILFIASGKEPGRNPYLQHLYRIGIDGGTPKLLTPEDLNHEISISPDGRYFIDNMSTASQPTRTVLRDAVSGKIISEISKADITGLTSLGYRFPETFTATARDGVTTIYGAIWKPTYFDPAKKYPVIDQSYTGPHTNMYPRSFSASINRSNQALAELGFIVVTIDGMGTAGRSKAFHNVSYKNMGKNLLDHVLAIRQLAKKYNWIDTTRVGIFGHSAGGYDAGHAMLEFPDFYKVAVASSADHDFRMEKDWWPEMYMGWPVDSTYHQASNITMAGNLKGKLLIVHGGIDENVNPSATFKLAEALVKADKEFDMLIFPSQRHGYQGKATLYFNKKLWNYFVEHLAGQKPIWNFELVQ
jgi:dipeptidyl-peptidase 4